MVLMIRPLSGSFILGDSGAHCLTPPKDARKQTDRVCFERDSVSRHHLEELVSFNVIHITWPPFSESFVVVGM